jgi:predicted PurR-regulated permease PerM
VAGAAADAADAAEQASRTAGAASDTAADATAIAEQAAKEAGRAAEHAREAAEAADDTPPADSLFDVRRDEDDPEPFGRPGRPISRSSPFYLGFVGALGVIAAWTLTQAIVSARQVLVLIVVSAFLAVGLNPLVELLIKRGLRRTAAVGIVFLGVITFFVLFAVAVVPPILEQSTLFRTNAPDLLDALARQDTIAALEREYGVLTQAERYVSSGDLGGRLFGGIVGVGRYVLGLTFAALTVLILTLYFLASLPSIKRQCYRLVPASRRERVALLGDEVLLRVGGYVSGAFIVALGAGVSALLLLLALDLEYALTLALVVAVSALVPLIGATVGAGVVTLVALTDSTSKALICIAFFVVYQQVENYVIYPRVMRRAVDVPPALTVMAALMGGALLGVVGALLAIPLAAAALLIVREVFVPRQDRV